MQTIEPSAAAAPRVVFEPYAPSFDADPHAQLRALRERDPVHWWEASQAWVISRYDDVAALLRDRRFSVRYADWELAKPQRGAGPCSRAFHRLLQHGIFALDDAGHARVRKLVSGAFTPRAVERMRAPVQAIVDEALAPFAPGSRVDLASEVADAIPLRAIGSLLGVPRRDEETFRRFGLAVAQAVNVPWLSDDEVEAITAPVPDGIALVRALIDERRGRRTGDLLGTLVATEEAGDRLGEDELVSLVAALIVAGSETTVHLVTFGVWTLLRHPDQMAMLVRDPSRVRAAIDELLRFDLFGRIGTPRYALEEVTLRGRRIRRGQMVLLLLASALRDPAVFPDPDRLDVTRDTSQTIAFGAGAHYCLGASLARLEGELALGTLLRRFPAMTLDGEPRFGAHLAMRKLASLPVRLGATPA